ncbi:prenyltransferase [Haloarculaceae archaeon H-GB2-1]|nr:prenyltransferase [Haloarculaceae archaeon H-GB2-1]
MTTALAVVPFFLVVLLNLIATQWPDREADAAVGKRTFAVRWSARRLRRSYVALAILAFGSLFALHPTILPTPVVLASLPVAPLTAWAASCYTSRHVPSPPWPRWSPSPSSNYSRGPGSLAERCSPSTNRPRASDQSHSRYDKRGHADSGSHP